MQYDRKLGTLYDADSGNAGSSRAVASSFRVSVTLRDVSQALPAGQSQQLFSVPSFSDVGECTVSGIIVLMHLISQNNACTWVPQARAPISSAPGCPCCCHVLAEKARRTIRSGERLTFERKTLLNECAPGCGSRQVVLPLHPRSLVARSSLLLTGATVPFQQDMSGPEKCCQRLSHSYHLPVMVMGRVTGLMRLL